MQTRQPDPIIAEVWAIRRAYAARLDYDVEAIFKDIQARQEASGAGIRAIASSPYRFRP